GFVAKYSASGQHLSSRRLGGVWNDEAHAVAVDSSGNVLVGGSFTGTVDFGGGPTQALGGGQSDVFVVKYAPTGAYLWARTFGGTSFDSCSGLAVDGSGNVVVTGTFTGAADFGGGALTSAGGSND